MANEHEALKERVALAILDWTHTPRPEAGPATLWQWELAKARASKVLAVLSTRPASPGAEERIAEVLAEGDGLWITCSGCYETSDGQNVFGYPHSRLFGCTLGGGCSECGGLGAVWDTTNYADPPLAALKPEDAADGWRPEVRAFADLMEAQLQANDHKPGWKGDCELDLFERLGEEKTELLKAIHRHGKWMMRGDNSVMENTEDRVGREAADVANFAMMIADVCGALPAPPKPPSSQQDREAG